MGIYYLIFIIYLYILATGLFKYRGRFLPELPYHCWQFWRCTGDKLSPGRPASWSTFWGVCGDTEMNTVTKITSSVFSWLNILAQSGSRTSAGFHYPKNPQSHMGGSPEPCFWLRWRQHKVYLTLWESPAKQVHFAKRHKALWRLFGEQKQIQGRKGRGRGERKQFSDQGRFWRGTWNRNCKPQGAQNKMPLIKK